jgi:hypothetical protein
MVTVSVNIAGSGQATMDHNATAPSRASRGIRRDFRTAGMRGI